MFRFKDFMEFLNEFREYKESKRLRIMHDYLTSDDFYGWLFKPSDDKKDIATLMTELYDKLCSKKVLKLIIETIKDNGVDQYTRSTATLLFSVVRFGLDSIETANRELDDSSLSRSEIKEQRAKINNYATIVAKVNDLCNKIVRADAKHLERSCGIPREVATAILKSVPERKFIDKFKISTFINIVLNEIYSGVNEYNSEIGDIEWYRLFKDIFGKDNILDVATFILLEGVHRIKALKNPNVQSVWDSLTAFALGELDHADKGSRTQMIELYIKRLSKMIKNGTYETRVDLLSLNEKQYPYLTKTIYEYKDKIEEIIKAAD